MITLAAVVTVSLAVMFILIERQPVIDADYISKYLPDVSAPVLAEARRSVGDEWVHKAVIDRFKEGNWTVDPKLGLTTLPAYHAAMAVLTMPAGPDSLLGLRIVSTVFSLLALIVVFLLLQHLPPPQRLVRSLQWFFLPVMLPYFILVYTDMLSLLLVLTMFLAADRRRFALAGLLGLTSLLVRQNNIIWLALLQGMIYVQHHGFVLSTRAVIHNLKTCWSFVVGAVLFVAYVLLNRGVSLDDPVNHPSFRLYSGNVLMCVFVAGILFAPLLLRRIPQGLAIARKQIWVWPLLAAGAMLFLFAFDLTNPYHRAMEALLTNKVATYAQLFMHYRIAFLIVLLGTLLLLCAVPLREKWHYLIYPATVLFLAPSWLIHARYFIIPFTLFTLYRRPAEPKWEWATLILLMAVSVFAMLTTWGI